MELQLLSLCIAATYYISAKHTHNETRVVVSPCISAHTSDTHDSGFSSLVRILGECSTILSTLALFFFSFLFLRRDLLVHTNFILYGRISPQWLSELRRLWPNVP